MTTRESQFGSKRSNAVSELHPPKVSVVTVSLNCREQMSRTLESVIKQTYANLEYIVIDGGSQDGTLGVIDQHRDRIDHLTAEPDNGVYDAMNKGLKAAAEDSQYITFLNAGDTFVSNTTVADTVSRASCDSQHLYGNVVTPSGRQSHPSRLSYFYLATNAICHQAIFFHTRKHKAHPYDLRYRIAADFDMVIRLLRKGHSFQMIDCDIACFEGDGLSSLQRERLHEEKRQIMRRVPALYLCRLAKRAARQCRDINRIGSKKSLFAP